MRTRKTFGVLPRLLLIAGAATALTIGPATAGLAHNQVIGTSPEADSIVTVQPKELSVTTNDALIDLEASAMIVEGPDGLFYNDGCAVVDGNSVTGTAELGASGKYTVTYLFTSIDGHATEGTFNFTWDPAEGEPIANGLKTQPVCGVSGSSVDNQEIHEATDAPVQGESVWVTVLWIAVAVAAVGGTVLLVIVKAKRSPLPPTE
ncbi:copper resistance CopC family protein [Lysinibacter cavernae]|uniref:CopC domain-containing protein n=1 Tax=Lysinibacter cavernae TaxID=1640652 RepID=A0A7X5R2B5_9MICO|nr:copper resistance CopC family protein [Lysinibacter cavernae]NIH54316.1 hypothetical protein [Lysinibacter cavernae]